MSGTPTPIWQSARMACGWGAAKFGDSTPGQWDYLAKWAGFESWEHMIASKDNSPPAQVELANAAIERREIWKRNSEGRS